MPNIKMPNGRRGLITDELVPLLIYIGVAAFVFVYIDFSEGIKAKQLDFLVAEKAENVWYYEILQDFVHKYGREVASSHDANDYSKARELADDHFTRYLKPKGYEWRLELVDSAGNKIQDFRTDYFALSRSRNAVAVAAIPLMGKDA
ncbi:hypothetical protein HYU10_03035, partial [Candidatus Woesearchaeota archaeon]|nr:hypothetical protein [Candidatus Woesearchaeota archaeon]